MSYTAEAVRAEMAFRVQETVRVSPGDTVKARIRAAAQFLGLSVGRAADYLYGEVRRVEAHEADQIRARHELVRIRAARIEAEYAALRAELVATAPRGLGWLVPPAIDAAAAVPHPTHERTRLNCAFPEARMTASNNHRECKNLAGQGEALPMRGDRYVVG